MIDFEKVEAEYRDQKPLMATYVIARLQQLVTAHGDLPVILGDRDMILSDIRTVDADGDTVGTPTEIALHGR